MDEIKKKAIQQIIDSSIKNFVEGFELRYTSEVNDPKGVINRKKNNCFVAELGKEFMFYSAFVRSFDSSFGKVLENMGNSIAKLSYDVRGNIESFLLPQQSQHMDYIVLEYERHTKPQILDYDNFYCIIPSDIRSFKKSHVTDHYFYNKEKKEHYLIELKSGGDLDNKKSKTEKLALLQEYFILKNSLIDKPDEKIKLFLATAYNMYGEGNEWKQERVKQYFAEEELLIGKDYWNFVCDDTEGFNVIFEQYKESANYIKNALSRIKQLYF
ncbi:MjaII restriction endonuclease [Anaerofustis stercorihominis DSM 17244]|uniref:type II site-specific deoxyribonuclease n=1 Tax=Anaerofustis stercorihominis DSM 17244 TaxID=445971 RepID=B1C9M4_9FIRM|nr:TdeIII family type II restriction endonuclease [Anaerofustis stercorihominis]EDS72595.1 MjaII restriction endonuclease [Anaerofustis stercorihominis DSM 17244]